MLEENSSVNEGIACEGCGCITASHEIFDFAGSPLCPACRQKYTGGDEKYEKQVTKDLAKRDAKWERWKVSVKKPLRMTVNDPDRDGASRIIVRAGVLMIVIPLLIIGWFAYSVGPDVLLDSFQSLDLIGNAGTLIIGAFVWLMFTFFTRTTITVKNEELEVKTTPFSFRIRDRRVPIGEVRDVELEHHMKRSSSSESRVRVYRLNLITQSGMEYRLMSGQSKRATYFVQKTLRAMLAARSEHFPEEWKA